ncbi:STAS domain-containing protein [Actinoplanes solisilvae]|uniref:STAS domain-containing protein n=1 Tax=Actinoplanes solisilvae TaxID=2486853 RepID=UPI00196B5835|nr:STAS domain-containing protein [Actinoplanes solisilvae]
MVYAAVRLIDVAGFRRLARFRRSELVLALAAMGGVLMFDILYGVLLAVALSVAETLARVARPHDAVEGLVPGLAGMHDVDDYPDAHTVPGLVVYRYDSPLFFANADDFYRRGLAAVDTQSEPVCWFLLNTEANVEVDITALDAVERLRHDLDDGLLPGFDAQLFLVPPAGVGVVAQANGAAGGLHWLTPEAAASARQVLGLPPPAPRDDLPHHPELWTDLCGRYRLSAYWTDPARLFLGAGAQVLVRRGRLTMRFLSPVRAPARRTIAARRSRRPVRLPQ